MSQVRELIFGSEMPPRSAVRLISAIQPEAPERQQWPDSVEKRIKNHATSAGLRYN